MDRPGPERIVASAWLESANVAFPVARGKSLPTPMNDGAAPGAGYDSVTKHRRSRDLGAAIVLLLMLAGMVLLGLGVAASTAVAQDVADQVRVPITIVHSAR